MSVSRSGSANGFSAWAKQLPIRVEEEAVHRALLCPFPATTPHPQAAQLANDCLEWTRKCGLLPDESPRTLDKVRSYSALAAHCYPDAHFERLRAICDYYSWLFFFDDVCENTSLNGAEPKVVSSLLFDVYGVLRGPTAAVGHAPFAQALADIWRRIGDGCPGFWRRRLIRHVENYIDGCVWEAQNRQLDRVPSRAVFEGMRMHTSTMYEFWDFIEYAGDLFLPDEVVEHPLVAEVRRAGNAIASFANDIYSLRKETSNRDVHNLVVVLMHEERIELEAAYARAAGIHDAQVEHFLDLVKHLPTFSATIDRNLARYVEGIRIWIRANHDWSIVTPRYNEPDAR
ncbi:MULTISPECIES: terpene synthase family protein [Sorangium]|uniref:terpene synthase family protein n=1 Tax=Sorangium TaxID=39643 RepID=UPI000322C79C|nr:hypothetical protein [Sorangium cellulosum]